MKSGIYVIENKINGKIYIGSTTNFDIRKGKHLRDLKANRHDNSRLQNSFNKHGVDNFEFEILFTCPVSELNKIEQSFIDNYNPEYNLLPKAYTSFGYKHTDISKKKMSNQRKGIKPVQATKVSAEKRMKTVYQYTKDKTFINSYKSTKEAQATTGVLSTNIAACARGKISHAHGFVWSYSLIN